MTSTLELRAGARGGEVSTLGEALAEPLIETESAEAAIRLADAEGMAFITRTPSGHELIIDAAEAAGGHDLGARPKELLLVALAGCTAMDVISILRKKHQAPAEYRVRVAATTRDEHPRVYTRIVMRHIVSGTEIDPAALARAIELSATKYCSVGAMLGATCPIEQQFRIISE